MADWLADQIFYEVFPDRFAQGLGDVYSRRGLFAARADLRGWDAPPRGRDFLGGDEALVALLDACRARGLRVVLDLDDPGVRAEPIEGEGALLARFFRERELDR